MTEETVKEKINFGPSSSIDESAEKVRIQESSNIEDNFQVTLSGTDGNVETGPTDNFENIYVAGTVGIGVASPSEKLEVSGTIKAIAFMGDGSEITALDGKKITTGIIEDSRIPSTISRENRFDPTTGHKHTGAAGDGPIISHSKLDEVLSANPDSSDTVTNKHISDALAKGWQDHITIKSGNPHRTTAIDIGALPISGGAINGTLQVETLQVNGKIETAGTVDGVEISNCFDPSRGHKHTGAAGDGPKISHSNLGDIIPANTESTDTTSTKHVSDALAKGWQDHITIMSGNPHGATAIDVGALSISGGTINGTLQVNGNIGIGTDTPSGKLDVRGDIRAGNSDLYFTKVDHNHTGIGNTDGLAAIENAADYGALMILGRQVVNKRIVRLWDYLQINGSMDITGNVGIGTTNPKDKLDVYGTIRLSGKNAFEDAKDGYLRINNLNEFPKGTTFPHRVSFFGGITTGDWYEVDPGHGNLLVNGKVGIGTTNPSARLEVNGNIKANSSELESLSVKGNVGIGTSFPSEKLEVNGDIKVSGQIVQEDWNAPQLSEDWTTMSPPHNPPGYFLDKSGVVHLRGMLRSKKKDAGNIFVLPTYYRPAYIEYHNISSSKPDVSCLIFPHGGVYINKTEKDNYASLDGITFKVKRMVTENQEITEANNGESMIIKKGVTFYLKLWEYPSTAYSLELSIRKNFEVVATSGSDTNGSSHDPKLREWKIKAVTQGKDDLRVEYWYDIRTGRLDKFELNFEIV